MSEAKWKLKSGSEIPVRLMGNKHLLNSISMLERWAMNRVRELRTRAYALANTMNPDTVASNDIEDTIERLEQEEWIDHVPDIYLDLVREASKRGLRR